MNIFIYDKTFEGLLSVVFESYQRKIKPDKLLEAEETLPLFHDLVITIGTDANKADRVWKGLEKKLSKPALSCLVMCWMCENPDIDMVIFRYICKAIDSPKSIELNFGDPDVLEVSKTGKKVNQEKHRIAQFLRFQKTADDIFFAAFEPMYNVLSFLTGHLKDRFADQKWLVYDLKRNLGYYYDLKTVTEVTFENREAHLISGKLSEDLMADDEKLFQTLWKQYFKSIAIKERINPKLHRQHMPKRFWKHLTEKQD